MWLYLICSYLIGTFLTAYVLAKWKGINLGIEGSGNFGARNAGRVLGKWAFVLTMLGDALKGVFVVVVGYLLEFSMLTVVIGLLCAVIGHVYPFWHRFKGGKGVATGVGGLLFVVPLGIVLLAAGFIIVAAITRSSTKGMLGAFFVYALYFAFHWSFASVGVWVVLIVIIWANRQNVAERVL